MNSRSKSWLLVVMLASVSPSVALAAAPTVTAPWDSVAAILLAKDAYVGGYHRYNLPRRDLTVKLGDLTLAPELAQGSWVGFSDNAQMTMAMGDLVLTPFELGPVLAELALLRIDVSAIHNHLVGEEPRLAYVHFDAEGQAVELARRLDRVFALTATPRPVAPAADAPLAIDTSLVWKGLGGTGRAHGSVAQLSFLLVPEKVTMNHMPLNAGQAYASPINIQQVDSTRAVATGDFAVLADKVEPVLQAFAARGITATALHTHMIGETPKVYFIHFWADGALGIVVQGLRAAIDATR